MSVMDLKQDITDCSSEKTIGVITDNTFVDHFSNTAALFLTSRSEVLKCPDCFQNIRTVIEIEPSGKTHFLAFLLIFLCMPCSFLPYCLYSCHNHHHYCPNCGGYIGTHYF